MSTKKLLTYEGLEEYNIKWHERLQEMMISDEEMIDILEEAFPPLLEIESISGKIHWTSTTFDSFTEFSPCRFSEEQVPLPRKISLRTDCSTTHSG